MDMEGSVGVPTSLMMDPGDRTEVEAIKFAVNRIRNTGFEAIDFAPGRSALHGRNLRGCCPSHLAALRISSRDHWHEEVRLPATTSV